MPSTPADRYGSEVSLSWRRQVSRRVRWSQAQNHVQYDGLCYISRATRPEVQCRWVSLCLVALASLPADGCLLEAFMWCGEVVVVLRWLLDRGESHQSLDNLIETSSSGQPGAADVTPIPHLDEKTWFIRCNRAEAEKLLRNTADGTFLIRPSTIAPYALSIVWVAVAVCIHSV